MKLKNIGSNMTEVTYTNEGPFSRKQETTVLFSYSTPVAAHSEQSMSFYKTTKKWSPTTTRHINKWLQAQGGPEVVLVADQSWFDTLVEVNGHVGRAYNNSGQATHLEEK